MITNKIPVKFDKLEKIFHCADIHIRNVRRHEEYRKVFDKLYKELKQDKENAICVVVGDIVHMKLEMSPELVDLTFDFFKNLAEILPTIVITGNHDCNLNNPNRLDVISPIVNNINHENLFYLKHSGVYDVADVKLVVMSVFQNPDDYIKANDINGKTKIALYHGTVQNAISETGFKLRNNKVTLKTFQGYDIVLLGDIHKHQFLDKKKHIAYCGSLIQQNFGEDLKHGLLKWNVPKRTSEFIHIPNDYAYMTLNINDGQMPNIDNLYPKSRLRLMIKNTPSSRLTEILTKIREKYPNLQDISEVKVSDSSLIQSEMNVNKINIGNVRDVSFQNVMIESYIKRHYMVNDEVINKIFEINKVLNSRLKPAEFQRNIVWKAKHFYFSNMFSYGEGNKIDFEKFKGIVGLFSSNRSGKSNLIESLCFTIFDKSPRALKSESAMNNKKNKFISKFSYNIGDREYRIKREGIRKKTGEVVVQTDFSVKNGDDDWQSLNGERRSSTNLNIRNYLGDYDSFIMTTLIPQIDLHKGTNANLINMRQADRKSLLNRFLDLDVFQELYYLAKEDMKTVEVKLENFEKRNFSKELSHYNIQIKLLSKQYEKLNKKKNEYELLNKKINKEIKKLTGMLIKVDSKTDINVLEDDKNTYEQRLSELKNKFDVCINQINKLEIEIKEITDQLNKIDDNIVNKFKILQEIEKQREEIQHSIDKYKIKIDTKREQLGDFGKLKFNPSCNECLKNKKIVENKMETEDDILENEIIVSTFKQQLMNLDNMIKEGDDVRKEYNLYHSLKEKINKSQNELSEQKHYCLSLERNMDDINRRLSDTIKDIETYHKNENIIKKNKEIQLKIDDWENKQTIVEKGIYEITNKIMALHTDIEINKNKKESIETEIEQVKQLEIQSAAYKFYMEAVEKDGVPFDLIVKTMPIIQHEVNSILSQMVDFQINFEIDEENKDIDPKIMYDGENVWAIELVSGMERFIASIAIRVALLSVSSLPRPNFLIIDEGFGSLDSENANSLYRLFEYLKTKFDFIITISHLDYIKDMADQIVELTVKDGFSKVIS